MFLDDSPTPAPSSFTPARVAVRTRVRWENFLLLFVVLAFGAVGVVAVVAGGAKPAAKPGANAPAAEAPTTVDPVAADPSTDATTTLTLDDAIGLVDEARQLMGEARWDEAADRLASVPADLRADSGADTLQAELETTAARHDQLRAQLDAAVEARQWKDADRLLEQLAAIAPLDDDLLEVRATVDSALAPHAPSSSTTDAAKDDASTASSGTGTTGGGSGARPQSSSHASSSHATTGGGSASGAHGSSTTKPAAGSKPTTGTSNAQPTNPSIDAGDLGSLQLTDEQQQALDQALGSLGDLQ